MSTGEVVWRGKQAAKATTHRLITRRSSISEQAAALRKQLPTLTCTFPIRYFDRQILWNFQDLPWQGGPEYEHLVLRHWTKIKYRNIHAHGDPKYTWELNRHQFIRHWFFRSNSIDAPVAFSLLITQWVEKNPYGFGINWTSSLEVALRLISWQSALQVIVRNQLDSHVLNLLRLSVLEHSRHISNFPSLYSSANNHRVGELVGQLAAAAMFPEVPVLAATAAQAWNKLQQAVRQQVSADGVCLEQATYYHAYVLLYMKRAIRYAEMLALPVPAELPGRINSMQKFLDATTDHFGSWFEIGDRDDGDLNALAEWTEKLKPVSAPAPNGFHPFPLGGYGIWKSENYHILFRAGTFGNPSIAAHAHADQLSVLLKFRNRDMLIDSGTYCYHTEPVWRKYFKGTAAHNTVRVDGHDQAVYAGPFLWRNAPDARLEYLDTQAAAGTLAVNYPKGTVTHTRNLNITLHQPEFLTVEDSLSAQDINQCHNYELTWNFAPGLQLQALPCHDDAMTFRFAVLTEDDSEHQPLAQVGIRVSKKSTFQIHCGDKHIPAGFYSRAFGSKQPITQLRVTCTAANWHVVTIFSKPSAA